MKIDIITLFPEMCEAVLSESIIGRARNNNLIEICCHQLRDYAFNKHKKVDDTPFGGGMGMLMMAEPIALCYEDIAKNAQTKPHLIYMSPQGKTLTQERIVELSKMDNICILCGHYEGVDERVIEEFVDEQISIGDYVLTGGELPAMVLVDSVARMVKGVLSDETCFTDESHFNGLLEYPQYTRPAVWRGKETPSVLLSGHHLNIAKWRRQQSIIRTKNNRKDMFLKAKLTKEEEKEFKQKDE